MERIRFSEALNLLDFDLKSVNLTLFFTSKIYSDKELFFEERLILDIAKKLSVSAVYFRRFAEKHSSNPQIFLFDNTSGYLSESELGEIHRKLWSSGIVPIYYVFDNTTINIFDARKHVQYDESTGSITVQPFDSLSIISTTYEKYKNYSAKLFENGTFWEQERNRDHFLSKESAENKLIEGLKEVRAKFIEESNIEKDLAQQLLVLSILVKYLEERKDEKGKHVFPPDFFNKYNNSTSFCEVLKTGNVVRLFNELSLHFNGKIFELSPKNSAILEKTDLSVLADFLDAKTETVGQGVLWPLFSFDYLPVEVISRIYEEFIPQRKDAVYTPVHLARLMVDECMPVAEPKQNFKVIDVSCGSGVFLVTVFKRLVQWWQKEQYDKTGELVFPEILDLKTILSNSVYGVDLMAASVQLSVFSLSIALCDMLNPTEIWTQLRFDDLREKNIYGKDFFKFMNETEKGQFDLVIGNPPFEDKKKDFDKLFKEFNIESDYPIPRNQIAMLFLQQAMKLLKPDGLLSFVMPSGPLLYNNTIEFRKQFFSRFEIPQIIDFSELRNASLLFNKTISTVVIFVSNRKPEKEHNILHITVKRTKSAKEKLFFEIDHYDLHNVPQEIAENNLIVWKSNLLGGNQLYFLINRFRQLRTFGDYLEEKKKNNGWVYGEGYNYGNRSRKAPHLTGHELLETSSFTENGILKTAIEKKEYFEGTRKKNKLIFITPHLLIKRTIGKYNFTAHYVDYDLIFKERIVGIHAPNGQEKQLVKIKDSLKQNYSFYKLFLLSTSAEAGINRSGGYVMYMKDIMNLPYSENEKDLTLSKNEEIIKNDVLKYKLEELSKGEKAKMNSSLASEMELKEFGKVFCESLNTIYENNDKKFKPLDPIQTLSYTCYPFAYGNHNFVPEISSKIKEGDLSELIENQKELVHYRRILRLYQKDLVFIVKPNTLRFWLKSMALRDANDVMVDLINSGY